VRAPNTDNSSSISRVSEQALTAAVAARSQNQRGCPLQLLRVCDRGSHLVLLLLLMR
jgi:hypothetical protein